MKKEFLMCFVPKKGFEYLLVVLKNLITSIDDSLENPNCRNSCDCSHKDPNDCSHCGLFIHI